MITHEPDPHGVRHKIEPGGAGCPQITQALLADHDMPKGHDRAVAFDRPLPPRQHRIGGNKIAAPSAGPGKPGCKLAAFLCGAAAALPERLRQHRCQGEKLLAVMLKQQEPRVGDPQPFPQRGGASGRQISALRALARLYRHGAFLRD
jgi:hypothetical protein